MTIQGLSNQESLNVGKISNPLFPGLIVSGILVPYDWYLPIASTDTDATILTNLQAALLALMVNNSYSARGMYVGAFVTFTDKSEATKYQTFGYGNKVKTQRQVTAKEYQLYDGGLEYSRAVMSFNGKIDDYKWLEIDAQGVIYGTGSKSAAGAFQGMQGVRLTTFELQDRKQANASTVEEWILHVEIADGAEVNENSYEFETGVNLDDFVSPLAVVDVKTISTGLMVAKAAYYRVLTYDREIDLVTTLPGLMIAANFVATNGDTGVAVTISTLAIVGDTIEVTYATGGGWDPGEPVLLGLASVSTIFTSVGGYYECVSSKAMASVIMVA